METQPDIRRVVPSGVASGSHPSEEEPAWGLAAPKISRWPVTLAILVAVGLYISLPNNLTLRFGAPELRWTVPGLELAILVPLYLTGLRESWRVAHWQRYASIALISLINAANVLSLIYLVDLLVNGTKTPGGNLLVDAANIWVTNVIVFALWYWELDRGGPVERCSLERPRPDFLFPQMSTPGATKARWAPHFVDYLYVSFTNATAFSPTDTMPLTDIAKGLMMVQSLASFATVGLVAARAINVLG